MSTFTRAPHSTCLTDKDGYTVAPDNPLSVNPAESGAAHFDNNQVALNASTATKIVDSNSTRRGVIIKNTDASIVIYIGDASVTTSNGFPLKAGEAISTPSTGAIYAIAASATPKAAFWEVYD